MDYLYTLLVLAIAVFALALGLYVLSKNPYHKPGRAFFLFMLLIAVHNLFHALLPNSPDEGTARAWSKAIMSSSILLGGSVCYLASFLPYTRYRGWPAQYARIFWAAVITLAAVFALADYSVIMISVGYGIDLSNISLLGYAICLALSAGASITAATARSGSKDPNFGRNVLLLAMVPLLPFILVVPFLVLGTPPLLAPGLMATSLIYAYLVLKNKVLSIPAPHHASKPSKAAQGDAVLMEGRQFRPAYEVFRGHVENGCSGLIVCRRHPDRIREETGASNVPMLWLSSQPGPDRIDPTSLNTLLHTVTTFIERSAPAVVLLEGVEYLISQNSLDHVLRMLYSLRDTVTVTGSKLIVLLDPDVLYERDLALMEKEFVLQEASA
jgi:hypothetical protein